MLQEGDNTGTRGGSLTSSGFLVSGVSLKEVMGPSWKRSCSSELELAEEEEDAEEILGSLSESSGKVSGFSMGRSILLSKHKRKIMSPLSLLKLKIMVMIMRLGKKKKKRNCTNVEAECS